TCRRVACRQLASAADSVSVLEVAMAANGSEEQAIEIAERAVRRRQDTARTIRGESRPLVAVEEKVVHDSLALMQAALVAALPRRGTDDVRMKAVHGCTIAQIELLWSGFEELLSGFYVAAAGKCRLIAELSDFIVAASQTEENATRVLN